MKKLILILMIILLRAGSSVGVTVQVGTDPYTFPDFPVYTCYDHTYSQQIYLGSEIVSGGGTNGLITHLRFYYGYGSMNYIPWQNWTIYMGNTTKEEFTSDTDWIPLSGMVQVFSGDIPQPLDGTWLEIALPVPFYYNGNNIVVAVDENSPGFDCTAEWGGSYTSTPRSMGALTDSYNNPDPAYPPPSTYSPAYMIPNIQFEISQDYGILQGYVNEMPLCTTGIQGAVVTAYPYSAVTDASGYYEMGLPPGTYYDVTAQYNNQQQTVSQVDILTGQMTQVDFCLLPYLAPPVQLKASISGPALNDVNLSWLEPGSVADQWIFWGNGMSGGSLGYGNYAITFSIASRWPVADIAPYSGTYLKKLRFVVHEPTATYTIKVWKGADASILLHSQPVTDPDINMWNEVALTAPVLIDGTDEFWFGIEITQTQGFPAGMDQGPAVAGKGDMFNAPGWGWISIKNTWNYDWNWTLQGFVSESPLLGPVAVTPMVQGSSESTMNVSGGSGFPAPVPSVMPVEQTAQNDMKTGPLMPETAGMTKSPASPAAPSSGVLTGYNVYRDNVVIASNIPDPFYDDLALPKGIYAYEVSAQYDIGESERIGPVNVQINTCHPPVSISVPNASLATTTAAVTWTPSPLSPNPDWYIEYGFSGLIPGIGWGTTAHVTGTSSFVMTGLLPGTEYDFYVRTYCSPGDTSPWVKKTFRTRSFDCQLNSVPETEACGDNTNYGCAQNPYAFETITCGDTICGTAWLQNSQRDEDWYAFTLTETMEMNITFFSEFTIKAILYNGTCPVTGWLYNVGIYKGYPHSIQLQLTAGTYYLMMAPEWGEEVVCDSLDNYWLTMNCSSCLRPTGLTATNITSTSADLQWTSGTTAWLVEWGPGGFYQGSGIVVNANTNPFTLTGLTEGYTYSYYVQAICNGNEYSPWAGPYSFSIPCTGTLSLPYYEDFSSHSLYQTPQCWQVTGAGTAQNWVTYPTDYAGGSYPELVFQSYPYISGGETYLLSPVINTTGETELTLEFNMMHYPYNTSPECGIRTTSDGGVTWNYVWTFSPYGSSGWQSITISTPDVGSPGFQFAFLFIGNSWDMGTWSIDDINLSGGAGGGKTLAVKLFLEGLYNGAGGLNQAYDDMGPHFAPGVADQVTLELRNEFSYPTLEFSTGPVDLGTDGMVNTTVPGSFTGNYFLTVRHRNSIETTTAFPVDFSGISVSFDFTIAQSQAYADNQKDNADGSWSIWSGDVNQDGIVDGGDMNPVDNLATAITFGYVPEDVNGDGIVDGGDMNIVDNNSTMIIMALVP